MNDPKEIADKYFERYAKGTSFASKVALVTLLVVICNWLLVVETNFETYKEENRKFTSQYQDIQLRLRQFDAISKDSTAYEARRTKLAKDKEKLIVTPRYF